MLLVLDEIIKLNGLNTSMELVQMTLCTVCKNFPLPGFYLIISSLQKSIFGLRTQSYRPIRWVHLPLLSEEFASKILKTQNDRLNVEKQKFLVQLIRESGGHPRTLQIISKSLLTENEFDSLTDFRNEVLQMSKNFTFAYPTSIEQMKALFKNEEVTYDSIIELVTVDDLIGNGEFLESYDDDKPNIVPKTSVFCLHRSIEKTKNEKNQTTKNSPIFILF